MGKHAYHGLYIALIGDLGAGKTHLVKGIASGLGITEEISSPTFTIVHEYETQPIPLYHFDLYRLEDGEELEDIGFSEYGKQGVTVVEWANRFLAEIPNHAILITFENISGETRRINLEAEDPRSIQWIREVKNDLAGN